MSSFVELEQQYAQLLIKRDGLSARYEAGDNSVLPEIQSVNQQIRIVLEQQSLLKETTSSGQVVQDDQAGYSNNSRPQDPTFSELVLKNGRVQAQPETTSGTNAISPTSTTNNTNWGVDGAVRPYSQTQSTTPGLGLQSPGAVYSVGGINPLRNNGIVGPTLPGGLSGVGAYSDDSGRTGTNDTVAQLNQINFGKVAPQPNVLNQYASYTYQASLYLLSADNYQRMINTNNKNLADAQLLVQTGGGSSVGRNEFFNLDYYIDDIELQSKVVGGGTRLAHNVVEANFKIIEPNGISFVQNLEAAVNQFLGTIDDKKKNYASQIYLMVIRFYGYDEQGNLVRGGVSSPNVSSDPNAFVEKWYPLIIKDLKFRIASKVVEYDIKAAVVPFFVAASAARGTIPFNVELSGQTIKDILAGPAVYDLGQSSVTAGGNGAAAAAAKAEITSTPTYDALGNFTGYETNIAAAANAAAARASAPPKADAASTVKKTVRQGIMAALNDYQQLLKAKKVITYPDTYDIEFAIPALATAKIINPGGLNKSATSMSTPGTAADQKLGTKQSMDPNSRIQGATAGMQIVQFIDNLLRNSTYIKDQQIVVNDEKTGDTKETGVNIVNTAWYKISFSATQGQYDPKRNDYAYHIKYIISPYKIAQLNSPYFKQPQYMGPHKKYNYWFTGENNAVLDYEERFNHLFFTLLTGSVDTTRITSNSLETLKFQAQTASGQSNMGADNNANEPAANAADQLYNPGDLAECNLTIVGDPAWLQQGEAAIGTNVRDQFYFQPFLADGTINFDSQQIMFEIGYNTATDYDIYTGLANPTRAALKNPQQFNQAGDTTAPTQINRIYLAKEVTSHFRKGKFTQDIKGRLKTFYSEKELASQGRTPAPTTPVTQTNKIKTLAPQFTPPRSSVTNPTPSSALAKGTQQILTPAVQADNPTLGQLQSSPVYIQAKLNGATSAAALDAARASFAAGTNNAANFAAPGIRTGPQKIVKEP